MAQSQLQFPMAPTVKQTPGAYNDKRISEPLRSTPALIAILPVAENAVAVLAGFAVPRIPLPRAVLCDRARAQFVLPD